MKPSPAKPLQPASVSAWRQLRSNGEHSPDTEENKPDKETRGSSHDTVQDQPDESIRSLIPISSGDELDEPVAIRRKSDEKARKPLKLPSYSKIHTKAQANRLFAGLLVLDFTVIAVVSTWYLTSPDPAGEDWRRYNNGLPAYLPRISYVGATYPAWFIFTTGMPLGVWLSFGPFMDYLRRLVTLCHVLGVPDTQSPSVHCFLNCCCCCLDTRRVAITADLEVGAPLVAAAPSCTCLPYMPYVIATIGPLYTASMWGLASLAVISLAFGPAGALWHYVAAATFFWGMDALCGLVLFLQWRLIEIWPERVKRDANIYRASYRYKALRAIFYTMLFVMFIADWSVMGFAIVQHTTDSSDGIDRPYNMLFWYFGYWGAIMQWTEISLISFFGFFVSYDLAAWPCDPETLDESGGGTKNETEEDVKRALAFDEHQRRLGDNEEVRKREILRLLRKSRGDYKHV